MSAGERFVNWFIAMILKNEINESSTTKNIAIEWLKLLQLNINRLAGVLGGLIPTQVLT